MDRGRSHATFGGRHDVTVPDGHVLAIGLHFGHELEPWVLFVILVKEGGRIARLGTERHEVADLGALRRLKKLNLALVFGLAAQYHTVGDLTSELFRAQVAKDNDQGVLHLLNRHELAQT